MQQKLLMSKINARLYHKSLISISKNDNLSCPYLIILPFSRSFPLSWAMPSFAWFCMVQTHVKTNDLHPELQALTTLSLWQNLYAKWEVKCQAHTLSRKPVPRFFRRRDWLVRLYMYYTGGCVSKTIHTHSSVTFQIHLLLEWIARRGLVHRPLPVFQILSPLNKIEKLGVAWGQG